jgi:low affinity Fe/Cu permease
VAPAQPTPPAARLVKSGRSCDVKRGKSKSKVGRLFEEISRRATLWTGSSWAFALAALVIIVWLATGPLFGYSDTWQLVINTGTTIVTFLMVFLIQRAQNKESLAVQLKLNEIVAAIAGASNRLIDVEDLSESELRLLHDHYVRLAAMAKKDTDLGQSHSIDEAQERHQDKLGQQAVIHKDHRHVSKEHRDERSGKPDGKDAGKDAGKHGSKEGGKDGGKHGGK